MLKSTLIAVIAAAVTCSLTAFDLVKNGVAQFTVSAGKTESEKKAVSELNRIVKAVTGADVKKAKPVNRIVIGTPETNPEIKKMAKYLGLDKKFDTDVISIKTRGNTMYAAGNNPRSAMYAVFEMLEQMGCRWFFDGPDGEYLPAKSKDLKVKDLSIFSKAAFSIRFMSYHQTRGAVNRSWFHAHNKMNVRGDGHKFGFTNSWGGHSFGRMYPPDCKNIKEYFKKYPEQFALVNGIRVRNQHCYTSPATFKTFSNWIDNFWKKNPDCEVLGLGALDSPIHCKCPECSKYDSSTLYFNFVKKLITEANKKHPGRKYSSFAYSFYLRPPKTDLRSVKNLTVYYCMYNRCYKHLFADKSCPVNPRALKGMQDWKNTGVQTALYGYHFDIFIGKKQVMTAFAPIIEEELRWMKKFGVREWYTECYSILNNRKKLHDQKCFVNRFQMYAIARLTWDPSRKLTDLLKEFCKYSFGPAAKEMEQYYILMQNAWMKDGHISYYHSNPAGLADKLITDDLLKKVDALFATALAKAKKDPRALKMVTADHEAWKNWRELKLARDNWKVLEKQEDPDRIEFMKKAKPGKLLYSFKQKRNGLMKTCTVAKDPDGSSYISYKPAYIKKRVANDGWLFGNHPRVFTWPCNWINYELSFSFRFPQNKTKTGVFFHLRTNGERFTEPFDHISLRITPRHVLAAYSHRKTNKKVNLGTIRMKQPLAPGWHKVNVRVIDTRMIVKLDGKVMLEKKIPLGRGMINLGSYQPLDVKDLTVHEIQSPSLSELWFTKIPYVKTAPVIDGKGNDAVWQKGYRSGRFTALSKNRPPTYATLLRTDKALYIRLECHEPAMNKVKAVQTTRDDGQYRDDCIELFLDPNNTKTDYFYLVSNAKGAQMDAMASVGMNINVKWNGKWKSVAGWEKDKWILEFELPFATFGTPKQGEHWLLGINRTGHFLRQSWTDASYHSPASFRTLDMDK